MMDPVVGGCIEKPFEKTEGSDGLGMNEQLVEICQ